MISVGIDFDDKEFIEFTDKLSPGKVGRAMHRTVRETSKWLRTHLLRLVKDEGIKRKAIVHRVQIYNKSWRDGSEKGKAVKVWFGIDPVPADTVGKPVKTSKGYRVKKWKFPGAFMPTKKEGMVGKLYQRTTKQRLPIQRSKIEIDEYAESALKKLEGQIPGRMRELAIRELKAEIRRLKI